MSRTLKNSFLTYGIYCNNTNTLLYIPFCTVKTENTLIFMMENRDIYD